MIFIIILISLLMERFFHWHHLRHSHWFKMYERWLSVRIAHWPAIAVFFCSILFPLVIVGVINYFLSDILFGIPEFIFGVVIILYCLGPENLWVQTYRCIHALSKDDPKIAIQQTRASFGIPVGEHSQLFHKKFVHAIFVAAHQRIFAIVFWFVIFGPMGAILYRMIGFYRTQSTSPIKSIAMRVGDGMDWISIRVFTFLFALGGHFTKVCICWKHYVLKGIGVNDSLLTECGFAAIDIVGRDDVIPESGEAERESIALLDRVFVMGLVILAIVVLMTDFS